MKEYNAYIDESGDEGIRKGSKFFILTAIVVENTKDLTIAKCVDEIKTNLELKKSDHLHWNKVKGYPNKKMILEKVAEQDLVIMNVVIDTSIINRVPVDKIYTYFSGYLYERLSWYMRDNNGICNLYISHRSQMMTSSITDYIYHPNATHRIIKERIGDVKIIPNAKKRLLQLADCCCSALGQALKYNDDTHMSYVDVILKKYYHNNGNICSYGLKFVPSSYNIPDSIQKIIKK